MNEGRGSPARPKPPPIARRAPQRPAEKTLPPGKGKRPPDDFFTASPREESGPTWRLEEWPATFGYGSPLAEREGYLLASREKDKKLNR